MEDHCVIGGRNFQTPKNRSNPQPPNHTSNCFIRQNKLFSVHLSHSGAIPELSGQYLRKGANWPPPPKKKLRQILEHKIFYIYNLIPKNFLTDCILLLGSTSERFLRGGGNPSSVEILSKILQFVEILFCQKWGFFENFRDTSTQITPKIAFHCIFIHKFPKNFEKSAQKFSRCLRRLWRRKRVEIPQFFRP